jgi:hypothetical protein
MLFTLEENHHLRLGTIDGKKLCVNGEKALLVLPSVDFCDTIPVYMHRIQTDRHKYAQRN